jgi:hypothetical protein
VTLARVMANELLEPTMNHGGETLGAAAANERAGVELLRCTAAQQNR